MSDATDNKEYDLEQVMVLADKVRLAVAKKLPDYVFYTRVHETAHFAFIELAAQPAKNPSPVNETQVAHSAMFYAGMAESSEVMLKRARRILRDMQIALGLPVEPAPDAQS